MISCADELFAKCFDPIKNTCAFYQDYYFVSGNLEGQTGEYDTVPCIPCRAYDDSLA